MRSEIEDRYPNVLSGMCCRKSTRESIIRYWRTARHFRRMEAEKRMRHYALPLETDVHIMIRKKESEGREFREKKEVNYVELIGRMAAEREPG